MLDISGLSNFTDKARKIYTKEIQIDDFSGWEMMKGVSGKEYIGFAEDNVQLQTLGCNLTPSGDTVVSQREVATCGIENLKVVCEDDNTLRFKAVDANELGKVLTQEYAKAEQKALNTLMYQGNVLSGDVCDGLYTYVSTDSDVVSLGDSTVFDVNNIDNAIDALVTKAYDLGINAYGVLTIYAPMSYVRLYRSWLKNNQIATTGKADTNGVNELWVAGEEGMVMLKGRHGLAGIDDMFISYEKNYLHIEDNVQNKDKIAKWSYVEHEGNAYYKSILFRGVNVKFPTHIVKLR